MSTESIALPVISGGIGAAGITSQLQAKKNIIVSGLVGTINIEAKTASNGWCTVATFKGRTLDQIITVVADEMRVNATSGEAVTVDVVAERGQTRSVDIPSPPDTGSGIPVGSEFLGCLTTFQVSGFSGKGVINIEGSGDGVTYEVITSFRADGCKTLDVSTRFLRATGNKGTGTISAAAEEPAISALTAPTDGIVYSQDNPNPGGNVYDTWQGAYDAIQSIKDPGPKSLYYHSRFGPSNARVNGGGPVCEIPAGPTASGSLTFNDDNGSGNSEITGADFLALGFSGDGGEQIFIKDAPTNGSPTVAYTTVSASSTALVLSGVVLADEGPVAARVILAWDMRGVKNLNLIDDDDTRETTTVVALSGAMAIGIEEISNRGAAGQPFNWYNDSSEPFAVFPDFTAGIISLGVNGVGGASVYSYDDTSAPFYELGADTGIAILFGSSGSGLGVIRSANSPAPVVRAQPLFATFGFIAVFFQGGGKLPGNYIEGSGIYFTTIQESPAEGQYNPENPSFINLLPFFFGDPVHTLFVPDGSPRHTVAQGLHVDDSLTYIPEGSSGSGNPEITGHDFAAAGFLGLSECVRVSGTASNDGVYTVIGADSTTLFLAPSGPEIYGTDLTAEGPVASTVHVCLRQGSFIFDLEDGETYFLETAVDRVGETIHLKSKTIPVGADITISGLPAAQSPSGAQELIDGAATQIIEEDGATGDSGLILQSNGVAWFVLSRVMSGSNRRESKGTKVIL